VLKMHRPEIEISRYSWNDATAGFTSSPVGRYLHTDQGWKVTTVGASPQT